MKILNLVCMHDNFGGKLICKTNEMVEKNVKSLHTDVASRRIS